jgi:hypothetical protein
MKAKINLLGLLLVTALAMSAIAASGAQATAKFMTQEGLAKNVNAEVVSQAVNIAHTFTIKDEKGAEQKLSCNMANLTSGGEIGFPREEVTLTPSYGECTIKGAEKVAVDINGCDYVFDNFIPAGGTWHGDLGVKCPAGKVIEFTLSKEGKLACTLTLLEKASVAGLTIENIATSGAPPTGGDLRLSTTVGGLATIYDPMILNGCVAFGVGKGTATYTGESTVQAKRKGALVDLTME